MTSRMASRISRDCVELGSEGRLIRMQLAELVGNVPADLDAIVHDYHAGSDAEGRPAPNVRIMTRSVSVPPTRTKPACS